MCVCICVGTYMYIYHGRMYITSWAGLDVVGLAIVRADWVCIALMCVGFMSASLEGMYVMDD